MSSLAAPGSFAASGSFAALAVLLSKWPKLPDPAIW